MQVCQNAMYDSKTFSNKQFMTQTARQNKNYLTVFSEIYNIAVFSINLHFILLVPLKFF